jgi:ureidoglycolate dehydrogenase (NAD+)
MIRVSSDELVRKSLGILSSIGVPERDARVLVESLIRADLRGIRSHGMSRLSMYVRLIRNGTIQPQREPEILRKGPCSALIDGNHCLGQVACRKAVEVVIGMARENSIGTVGIRNIGHAGHISDYTRMIQKEGLIGVMYLSSDSTVAPFGGKSKIIGTNPISFALPAGREDAIIVDFATSATAGGYIVERLRKGEKMPVGWAVDGAGKSTTDPKDLFKSASLPIAWGSNFVGAILPAAGHKGYALGLIVEVLAGALTGGKVNGDITIGENYAYMQAISPDCFVSMDEYQSVVDTLVRKCRESSPQPGVTAVLIPGDPERRAEEENARLGIPLEDSLWEELETLERESAP